MKGDDGKEKEKEGKREIAWRGLREGSALSCKSVRSVSPPGGMVAYVKAGYTPRDEWTLFRAFLLLTLCSRFCTLTCRCLRTRARERESERAPARMREYLLACMPLCCLPPTLPRNLFSLPLPATSDGIDNPLILSSRTARCSRARVSPGERALHRRPLFPLARLPWQSGAERAPQIGPSFRRTMSYVAGLTAFFSRLSRVRENYRPRDSQVSPRLCPFFTRRGNGNGGIIKAGIDQTTGRDL